MGSEELDFVGMSVEEFLADYPKNENAAFSCATEDLQSVRLISEYMAEIAAGEARMLQESATMRFVG